MILVAMAFVLYNTGKASTDKTHLTTAADAATYSAATQKARALNYLAYTNRAMISNHMSVGHMTAYTSWLLYVEKAVRNIDRITKFVPRLGSVISAVKKYVNANRGVFEKVAGEAFSVGVIALNFSLYETQLEVQKTLLAPSIQGLQGRILSGFSDRYSREQAGSEILRTNQTARAVAALALTEYVELTSYLKVSGYVPSDDERQLFDLIKRTQSYAVSKGVPRKWLKVRDARSWRIDLAVIKVRKTGTTEATLVDNTLGWEASDITRYKLCIGLCSGYRKLASGSFDSDEWNYDGIKRYVSVQNLNPEEAQVFTSSILVGSSQRGELMANGPGTSPNEAQKLYAASCAETFFYRPFFSGSSIREEYPNVFNPFWKVRLASIDECGENKFQERSAKN